MAYPYGGGVNLRRDPPTKPPRPHKGKYKEKSFPAPLAPGIYRGMGQRRPTSDLPLPQGGGSRLNEAPNFFKKAPPPCRVGRPLSKGLAYFPVFVHPDKLLATRPLERTVFMRNFSSILVCQQELQGVEIRTLGPVTSIRTKNKKFWYASKGCRVQKLGPWVWFCGGCSTG